jgi:endonuclease YncB( thermonuclease family)
MKSLGKWWPAPALMLLSGTLLSGCTLLEGPQPEPVPTPMTKAQVPGAATGVFSPADYITKGTDLPGRYRVTNVSSGELVTIQSVNEQAGKPPILGTPEVVHIAGIITPAPGQPGWQGAVSAVQNWTVLNPKSRTVRVEQDPRFPTDFNNRRMVQIYFNGSTDATASTEYNLNRMMVRSGWAVVDLHSATSIDIQKWLNDEQYARQQRLGLWKQNIILAQRQPLPMPGGTKMKGTQRVTIQTAGAAGAPTSPAPPGAASPPAPGAPAGRPPDAPPDVPAGAPPDANARPDSGPPSAPDPNARPDTRP